MTTRNRCSAVLLSAGLTVAAGALVACQGEAESPAEPSGETAPTEIAPPPAETSPVVQTPAEAVAIPADFPSEIPIHPDGTPVKVMKGNRGFELNLDIPSPVTDVTNWYRDSLPKAGFANEGEASLGNQTLITAKSDVLSLAVFIMPKGEGTDVRIHTAAVAPN